MRTRPSLLFVLFAVAALAALVARADEPAARPVELDATDKAALDGAANKEVTVTGTIARARWSNSGKVMTVEFENSPLLAAVFERSKEAVNAAFGGDAAKAWTGAKVKVTGRLGKYGGKVKQYEDRPQIVITRGEQVTVVEAKKE
jgi:DNA/RNA endonuclease YhcR with UshA esterase domain